MTKLKLNFSQDAASILSREEMKQVFGGYMSGSGDTGSGCYWYLCTCSGPNSMTTVGSTENRRVQVYAGEDPVTKLADGCSGYQNVSCTQNIPCHPM